MYPLFDRTQLSIKPLHARQSKSDLNCLFPLDGELPPLPAEAEPLVDYIAKAILRAKAAKAPVMLSYGAHMFKNGLSLLIIRLLEEGYIQHLSTNGAGTIHDWELAYQGRTEEDVKRYIKEGQFGIWQETGFNTNLAVIVGVAEGLGYGASVGKMIAQDGLNIPDPAILRKELLHDLANNPASEGQVAKLNLLRAIEEFKLPVGWLPIAHPHKQVSIQGTAFRLGIPFSVCPGIGYDIIYSHPINSGAAIGQGSVNDFLSIAQTVSNLENGVYLSIGSAIMSPMTFEKAISMARNLALQQGRPLENYDILVNDIQPGTWDWHQGEPPKTHPAYYLRFCKSFSRMGGRFQYLELDNTLLVRHLARKLLG